MAAAAAAAAAAAPRNNASFVVHYSLLLLVLVAALSSFAAAQQTVAPNVTQVLTDAGNFKTFLSVAGAANVTQALQSFISANNTAGATAFIPVDSAFTTEIVAAYSNLSAANQSLVLYYHVLPRFYNATDVVTLSDVATLASGNSSSAFRIRAVNQSSSSGVITVYGNFNSANVTNKTGLNGTAFPIAIHPIDTVLLPNEIFGTPPPAPAPAPVPASDNNSTVTPPASAPTPAPTSDNNSTVTPPAPAPAPASNNNGTSKAPAPAPATNTTSKTTTTAPAPNGTAHTTLFLSLSLSLLLLSFHLIFFLA